MCTIFGVLFCEDFCTLGSLDLPVLYEFLTGVSELSPLAWDLVGFSGVLTTFDFCTLPFLNMPCLFFGTDCSELTPFASDMVFSGVLITFGIDGSDIIASLDLVPNIHKSFDVYFMTNWGIFAFLHLLESSVHLTL